MKLTIAILFVALLSISCDRTKEPLVYEGDVVFSVEAQIGSEDVTIEAGKDDYYMYTAYEQDERGMYSFIGELKKKGEDGHGFKFLVNDVEFSQKGESSHVEEALKPEAYEFERPPEQVDFLKVTLEPNEWHANSNDKISYQWTDKNGRVAVTRSAEFYYRKENFDATEVCLEMVNESQGVRRTACNVVYYDNDCEAEFDFDHISNSFNFFVNNPDPTAFYLWIFSSNGGAQLMEGSQVQVEYIPMVMDEVCLTSGKTGECGRVWCQNVIVDSSAVVSIANMDYSISEVLLEAEQAYPLGQFRMEYTDPSGKVYRSEEGLQGANSEFRILDVSEYDDNELGQKTMKLSISLTCDLQGEDGSIMHIENMEGTIAMAHP